MNADGRRHTYCGWRSCNRARPQRRLSSTSGMRGRGPQGVRSYPLEVREADHAALRRRTASLDPRRLLQGPHIGRMLPRTYRPPRIPGMMRSTVIVDSLRMRPHAKHGHVVPSPNTLSSQARRRLRSRLLPRSFRFVVPREEEELRRVAISGPRKGDASPLRSVPALTSEATPSTAHRCEVRNGSKPRTKSAQRTDSASPSAG